MSQVRCDDQHRECVDGSVLCVAWRFGLIMNGRNLPMDIKRWILSYTTFFSFVSLFLDIFWILLFPCSHHSFLSSLYSFFPVRIS
ncbi:hypothetical protein VTJ04DRAFT_6839 [Mycothermus thermophilus]|uniref:uncharacterized protein n=1 Tax=Humicola insolens TaxID=85995 RepID=UPI0037431070